MQNNIYIMNYWGSRNNYGAILTAYALQSVIKEYNQNTYLTEDVNKFLKYYDFRYTFSLNFRKNHFNIITFNKILNDKAPNIFITGSDQVFRPGTPGPNLRFSQYFLDFVKDNSKKIAFSASFGFDKEQFLERTNSKIVEKMKKSLKSFDYLSVREKSAVEICKDLFDIDAEWIIDPVFMVDRANYDELIKNADKKFIQKVQEGSIAAYILDNVKENKKVYKYLSKKYNKKVIELADSNLSVENWLAAVRDCDLFVTNSFHGLCFAIIFNKPFICIANQNRGLTRFNSLLELLNIEYSCVGSITDLYDNDFVFNGDYTKINDNISIRVQDGRKFLEKALNTSLNLTQEQISYRNESIKQFEEGMIEDKKFTNKFNHIRHNIFLTLFYNVPNCIRLYIRSLLSRRKNG